MPKYIPVTEIIPARVTAILPPPIPEQYPQTFGRFPENPARQVPGVVLDCDDMARGGAWPPKEFP